MNGPEPAAPAEPQVSLPPVEPQAPPPPTAPPPPPAQAYPATFAVDYKEPLARLSTFFRIFAAIPILIILGFLVGGSWSSGDADNYRYSWEYGAVGILFAPTLLMILFRQKYPRWWFDWNLNLTRFMARVYTYLALLRDEYPSTDEEQSVHLDFPYPDVPNELNRWLPLVKWFLAIPHWIVLWFLWIGAAVAIVIAWFAILFTGRYPRGLFDFVVGVFRWTLRAVAYSFLLVTDRYPPFRLRE